MTPLAKTTRREMRVKRIVFEKLAISVNIHIMFFVSLGFEKVKSLHFHPFLSPSHYKFRQNHLALLHHYYLYLVLCSLPSALGNSRLSFNSFISSFHKKF